LPHLSNGQILLGVGFSHLRRAGDPLIVAVPATGGYQLQGHVPWVTGFGLFQEFIVAAALPDGQAVFGVVPFVETYQDALGAITFSQPMALAAMTSTNTSPPLTNWFYPRARRLKPSGWIQENDKRMFSSRLAALGYLAGLDIMHAAHSTKQLFFIAQAFEALELADCRSARQAQLQCESLEKRLQLRAWAIDWQFDVPTLP